MKFDLDCDGMFDVCELCGWLIVKEFVVVDFDCDGILMFDEYLLVVV